MIRIFIGKFEIKQITSCEVETFYNSLSDSFTLSVPFDMRTVEQIYVGQSILFTVEDTLVFTGQIETLETTDDYSLILSGRSMASILLEATPPITSFRTVCISKIIADLCRPFGIPVVSNISTTIVSRFVTSPEKSIYENIMELLDNTGYILSSNGDGSLALIDPSKLKDSTDTIMVLEEGVNIVGLPRISISNCSTFHRYTVIAQNSFLDSLDESKIECWKTSSIDGLVLRNRQGMKEVVVESSRYNQNRTSIDIAKEAENLRNKIDGSVETDFVDVIGCSLFLKGFFVELISSYLKVNSKIRVIESSKWKLWKGSDSAVNQITSLTLVPRIKYNMVSEDKASDDFSLWLG